MSLTLRLEGSGDVLDLNGIYKTGYGYEALVGMTGLGLPELSLQYQAGAGDGATYRGQRVQPRDLDIPLDIRGRNRAELKTLISRLSRVLAGNVLLVITELDGTEWNLPVRRAGGGSIQYGIDTVGTSEAQMVLTLRAGDPFFTSAAVQTDVVVAGTSAAPFVANMLKMPVDASQAQGIIQIDNIGDAPTYPVWTVVGPGNDFKAISPRGETLRWQGTLTAGQTLTIDTRTASVKRENGSNVYANLAAAPRFWSVPPGISSSDVSLQGTTSASKIICTWRARKWMVV